LLGFAFTPSSWQSQPGSGAGTGVLLLLQHSAVITLISDRLTGRASGASAGRLARPSAGPPRVAMPRRIKRGAGCVAATTTGRTRRAAIANALGRMHAADQISRGPLHCTALRCNACPRLTMPCSASSPGRRALGFNASSTGGSNLMCAPCDFHTAGRGSSPSHPRRRRLPEAIWGRRPSQGKGLSTSHYCMPRLLVDDAVTFRPSRLALQLSSICRARLREILSPCSDMCTLSFFFYVILCAPRVYLRFLFWLGFSSILLVFF